MQAGQRIVRRGRGIGLSLTYGAHSSLEFPWYELENAITTASAAE